MFPFLRSKFLHLQLGFQWIYSHYPRRSRRRNFLESLYFLWAEGLTFGGKMLLLLGFGFGVLAWRPEGQIWLILGAIWAIGVGFAFLMSWFYPLKAPLGAKRNFPPTGIEKNWYGIRWEWLEDANSTSPPRDLSKLQLKEARLVDGLESRQGELDTAEDAQELLVRGLRPGFFELHGWNLSQIEVMGLATTRRTIPQSEGWMLHHQAPEWKFIRALERLGYSALDRGGNPWTEMEWKSLRPYQAGDRLRDVDARAWAKRGKPVTREYEESSPQRQLWWVHLEALNSSLLYPWVYQAQLRLASALCRFLASQNALGGIALRGQAFETQNSGDPTACLDLLAIQNCGFRHIWLELRGKALTAQDALQEIPSQKAAFKSLLLQRLEGLREIPYQNLIQLKVLNIENQSETTQSSPSSEFPAKPQDWIGIQGSLGLQSKKHASQVTQKLRPSREPGLTVLWSSAWQENWETLESQS